MILVKNQWGQCRLKMYAFGRTQPNLFTTRTAASADERALAREPINGTSIHKTAIWLYDTIICKRLRVQLIDATHALKRSAGVSNSNVLRGRSFN